jgi:hypothetical protein
MNFNLPGWTYPVILVIVLIIAGAGEYLHMAPAGTFRDLLILIVGLLAPSPGFPHTQVITPTATVNTNKTTIEADKAVTPPS